MDINYRKLCQVRPPVRKEMSLVFDWYTCNNVTQIEFMCKNIRVQLNVGNYN